MKMRTTLLSAVIVGAFSVGTACAGSLVGTAAIASADITLAANTQVTNTMTAVSSLTGGQVAGKTVLAEGSISSVDGQPHRYAVRITNGNYVDKDQFGAPIMEIAGNNNSANVVRVYLGSTDEASIPTGIENVNGADFRVTNNEVPGTFGYRLLSNPDMATVNPDTYTVWTEAYIYNL